MTSLSAVARHLLFVRETEGPNRGAWVSFFQRFTGGQEGDSWCADFVSVVLDIAYRGQSPLPKTGSTFTMLSEARGRGWIVPTPRPDDLYFFVNNAGVPHHVGIVTAAVPLTGPLMGIAGNTSEDGQSSNGTGVFEHAIDVLPSKIVFIRLPTLDP